MSKVRVSKAQMELLDYLRLMKCNIVYYKDYPAAFTRNRIPIRPRMWNPRTVDVLLRLGMLAPVGNDEYTITDAGREVVTAADTKES